MSRDVAGAVNNADHARFDKLTHDSFDWFPSKGKFRCTYLLLSIIKQVPIPFQ